MAGVISIFDFAMRPAVPSIMRIVYPDRSRSHASGTIGQYASIVFLAATLVSAAFLSTATNHVLIAIRIELPLAAPGCAGACFCFSTPPDHAGRASSPHVL